MAFSIRLPSTWMVYGCQKGAGQDPAVVEKAGAPLCRNRILSLTQWTEEDWGTRSGRKSTKTGERYLPRKAREALSEKEYARTTRKKREDTKRGKQFSAQPEDIKREAAKYRQGGRSEDGGEPTKAELYQEAKRRGIEGRFRMTRAELQKALA